MSRRCLVSRSHITFPPCLIVWASFSASVCAASLASPSSATYLDAGSAAARAFTSVSSTGGLDSAVCLSEYLELKEGPIEVAISRIFDFGLGTGLARGDEPELGLLLGCNLTSLE